MQHIARNNVGRCCIQHVAFLSTGLKAKFFILCDAIFLVRLQGKVEIDRSWVNENCKWDNGKSELFHCTALNTSGVIFVVNKSMDKGQRMDKGKPFAICPLHNKSIEIRENRPLLANCAIVAGFTSSVRLYSQ